jgi:hypothetical protein
MVNGTTYTNPDSLTATASCFVDEWKDQSGNANHAEQTVPASQPQIHSGLASTDLILENGKPIVRSIASSQLIMPIDTQGDYDIYSVSKVDVKSIYMGNDATGNDFLLAAQSGSTSTSIKSGTVTINSSRKNGAAHTFGTRGDIFTNFSGQHLMYLDVDFNFTNTGNHLFGYANVSTWSMWSAQEIIIYPNTVAYTPLAIETNVNSEFLIYQPTDAPTSGLLATYTGAAAAYSVRQLSDKAVIALRVRRDSDDEETNIGFDSNGDLDTTAISDFCSTANGYVTRWWDQSTNGNHADQPVGGTGSNVNQPLIYNGTAVIEENGKPALNFDKSNDQNLRLASTSYLTNTNDMGFFAVCKSSTSPNSFTCAATISNVNTYYVLLANNTAQVKYHSVQNW